VEVEGDSYQIGLQHGLKLRNSIQVTIQNYKKLFRLPEEKIFYYATHFENLIKEFDQSYANEIEGIAEGALVDKRWIYALNSRTEIMDNSLLPMNDQECSTIFFSDNKILGQNWDWYRDFESLATIIKIKRKEKGKIFPEILMMTEPGIIGKIGMNSNGIGCCLNKIVLNTKIEHLGLPVHIRLRAALDSNSIQEFETKTISWWSGTASAIFIGSSDGQSLHLEFAGEKFFQERRKSPSMEKLFRTNHYLLSFGTQVNEIKRINSLERYENLQRYNLLNEKKSGSVEMIKEILLDKSEGEKAICRDYKNDPHGEIGTLCSIIMDLPNLNFYFKRSPSLLAVFHTFHLDKNEV